jgi:adenylate cyclase
MDDVHLKRRLTAVLLADVVGYSRLMNADEEGTHVRLAERVRTLIEPAVAEHHGRPVRSMGDGMLVEFDSAVDAVRCAADIQRGLAAHASEGKDRRIQLRIGVNTGDVIVDERDIYGNSINIAARLQQLAEPGQICVTRGVRDQLRGYPDISFADRGEHRVKNIDRPIRVFRVGYDEKPRAKSAWQRFAGSYRPLRPVLLRHRRATSLAAGMLLAGLAVLGMTVPPGWFITVALAPRNSIVVMPFNNFSGDSKQDYFADAVTDDLTTDLSRVPGALVIASSTAFTYKGKAVDARQVGKECNVRYILEGSINKIGNLIHANARLVEAASGAQIWSERFEKEFVNLPELEDTITGRIASSLEIQLIKAEVRAPSLADPNATDLRLHAMALLLSPITFQHHLAARHYLEESLRIGPETAEAWGQLANLMMNDYYNHWTQPGEPLKVLRQKAEEAVHNALRLDPTVAIAHVADGMVLRAKGDHLAALDAFDQAIQLDPNFARAWAQKANELVMVGRPEEAPPLVLRAIALSPRDPALPVYYWHIGRAYFVMKKYREAIVWIRKSVELRDNAWYTWAYLVSAYELNRQSGPEVTDAIKKLKKDFKEYTIKTIRHVYDVENPQDNSRMKYSILALTKGLRKAGIPER